jgi:hypothetical protein
MDSDLTPMAELASRWGINSNTVSRRLSFLGVKPERQGNLRFISAEHLHMGDALNEHLNCCKTLASYKGPFADRGQGKIAPLQGLSIGPAESACVLGINLASTSLPEAIAVMVEAWLVAQDVSAPS